jgi:hypothetical protein
MPSGRRYLKETSMTKELKAMKVLPLRQQMLAISEFLVDGSFPSQELDRFPGINLLGYASLNLAAAFNVQQSMILSQDYSRELGAQW